MMRILSILTICLTVTFAQTPEETDTVVKSEPDLFSNDYDIVVFVNDVARNLGAQLQPIETAVQSFLGINPSAGSSLNIIPFPEHPCRKLMFASTGSLSTDIADSRQIYDAAVSAMNRVYGLGFKKILLVVGPMNTALSMYKFAQGSNPIITAGLGALYALYVPFQERQMTDIKRKFDLLGIYKVQEPIKQAIIGIASGVAVTRDIGNGDPEIMAAPKVAQYIQSREADWKSAGISIEIMQPDPKRHPMAWAVNRAASIVPRHFGRIIYLRYDPPAGVNINQTLLIVGKGVTIDTGGADLKISGGMYGMHNDKMGAAAVAGFFETLSHLKPKGLKVFGYMPMIRNSIGKLAFLPDEIVVARNGMRARIGNTDAEGRMIMSDVLYEAQKQASQETNPHVFTIATLTGAAVAAFGDFTVTMDNGPAAAIRMAQSMSEAGDEIGDPTEVARVRSDDYAVNYPISMYEDIMQYNTRPGSTSHRGFTYPMAFLATISDLANHGLDSGSPIPYTHSDIAGSGGGIGTLGTGAPVRLFAKRFILSRFFEQYS